MCLESGKPRGEAKGELNYAKSFIDLYAGMGTNGLVLPPQNSRHMLLVIKEVSRMHKVPVCGVRCSRLALGLGDRLKFMRNVRTLVWLVCSDGCSYISLSAYLCVPIPVRPFECHSPVGSPVCALTWRFFRKYSQH